MPEKDADDWDECPESVRIEKDMNAQYNALNKKKKKITKKNYSTRDSQMVTHSSTNLAI